MKRMITAAIIIIGFCFCITPTEAIKEEAILAALEQFRNRMCHPIPKFGLPPLDPLVKSHFEYSVNNAYLINFNSSVTNFRLTGLSDFMINKLKITTVPLKRSTLDVTMPLTAFKSIYTAEGSLLHVVRLAGEGNAEASVEDVHIVISWIFKTGIRLSIRSLKITVTIADLKFDFENLFEEKRINDFFHALVNEIGLELLGDIWNEKSTTVEQIVEEKINVYLGQYTLSEIINIITANGGPIFGPEDPPADCKATLT